MGERIQAAELPDFSVEVEGNAWIDWVELVRDGEVVQHFDMIRGKSFETTVPGGDPVEEETWTYVHVMQDDGNQAWSSPIWVRP